MAATIEGQERVMAAAKQIVKSLNTSKDATEDMLLILSSFDNRLSNITSLMSNGTESGGGGDCAGGDGDCKIDPRFEAAEEVILRWDSNSDASRHSLRWEDSPDEAAEYLAAVDEILQLTEDLTIRSGIEIVDRAESALQLAMLRLEDEFRHILIQNTVPLDTERLYGSIRRGSLSFASNDGEIEDFGSFGGDEQVSYCRVRGASLGDDVRVDLIHPDAVVELKEIADRMIRSGRRVLSSKIEWTSLDEKMRKWIQAVKIVVRALLNGEKQLCEQIFEGSELIKEVCFVETAKGCVMQFLNFGEAVAIGRRSSEKLFRILDMYDVLMVVFSDLQMLFSDESGELVCSEARGVLAGLGEAAIGTFVEFENAVQGEASRKPTLGGEIHPLTRYVLNYVKLLVDYSETLNTLLENIGDEYDRLEGDDGNNTSLEGTSPIARRLLLLLKSLESNLEEKSRMYEDGAMQYIFLMNNILYVVQKVKDSELGKLLGDQWVRKRRGQIRQYATAYLRSSWTKVLSFLKDEGIGGSSGNASKLALKERFKNFNAAFEEIYRTQTAWKVPDAQLREELRISISEKVLPAYRSFLGRLEFS
ncbi:hypothetical protein TEA_025821 [Camellia sinensis var. sinensis]|uniref:Exocyst subunit Exo70 family protein n=1 Tax=Camellia sinensis var. sinensis TaxID=542762 RepID=A0A4S4E6C4_CAMSN|nr:hypothetical protein TEA_025821 [Camellia sinensis var. sinensis]